jgi:hypothetical protein
VPQHALYARHARVRTHCSSQSFTVPLDGRGKRSPAAVRCDAIVIKARGMPMLHNPKHERFAQNIATAAKTKWSNGRCYSEAGFKTDNRSADACAARLLTNANVSARIEELLAPTVRKTRTTVDTLAEQFDRVFSGALDAEQFGAAGNAAGLKARLLGFMRERIEIGAPGSFDACETTEQVVTALLSDQTASEVLASLAALSAQVEAYAASHATVIRAAEPARPREPGSEAERSLALLRPKPRRR